MVKAKDILDTRKTPLPRPEFRDTWHSALSARAIEEARAQKLDEIRDRADRVRIAVSRALEPLTSPRWTRWRRTRRVLRIAWLLARPWRWRHP